MLLNGELFLFLVGVGPLEGASRLRVRLEQVKVVVKNEGAEAWGPTQITHSHLRYGRVVLAKALTQNLKLSKGHLCLLFIFESSCLIGHYRGLQEGREWLLGGGSLFPLKLCNSLANLQEIGIV